MQGPNAHAIPKAIIFDWDNTLVDTWALILGAMNKTLTAMDIETWDLKTYQQKSKGRARDDYFPEIFGKKWQEASRAFEQNFYRDDYLEDLRCLPHIAALIKHLNEQAIPLMIVSSKDGVTLRKEVKALELEDKFLAVVGAGDAQKNKPAKDVVDLALKQSQLNLDPQTDLIWFIGDSDSDIECAYNAHCQPVLYGNETITPSLQHVEKPILYFDDLPLVRPRKI